MTTSNVFILMGVSGCGKSTIGQALANATQGAFIDADHLHSPENVEKMRSGIPLTDADRAEWLDAVASVVHEKADNGTPKFIACSALKKTYRQKLDDGPNTPTFLFLHAPEPVLQARLEKRKNHYMPASLLQSQLETLEPPTPDETALAVDVSQEPDAVARDILSKLSLP
ncbi:MAG: gluconokinase [Verrucomicrobiota bacterium]